MVTSPAGTVDTFKGAVTRRTGEPSIGADGLAGEKAGIEVDIADDGVIPSVDVGEVIAEGVGAAVEVGAGIDVGGWVLVKPFVPWRC